MESSAEEHKKNLVETKEQEQLQSVRAHRRRFLFWHLRAYCMATLPSHWNSHRSRPMLLVEGRPWRLQAFGVPTFLQHLPFCTYTCLDSGGQGHVLTPILWGILYSLQPAQGKATKPSRMLIGIWPSKNTTRQASTIQSTKRVYWSTSKLLEIVSWAFSRLSVWTTSSQPTFQTELLAGRRRQEVARTEFLMWKTQLFNL